MALEQAEVGIEELPADRDFVDFRIAGTRGGGEFRCAECGYGAIIQRELPACPMCGGTVWEVEQRRPRLQ